MKLGAPFNLIICLFAAFSLMTSCGETTAPESDNPKGADSEASAEADTDGYVEPERDFNVDSRRARKDEVIVQESADFDMLNPYNSRSANSTYVKDKLFQSLIDIHPETYKNVPVIAKALPILENLEEGEYAGGMSITYEIREEAKWDNGTPITAEDVVFGYKAIKNPQTNCESWRGYMEFIDDVVIDPNNPRKFTVYSKERYFMADLWTGSTVIPEYVYDPQKIMRSFTIKELDDPDNKSKLLSDPQILKFAEEWNSEKYNREKGYIVGSGPYEFSNWKTGESLIVTRKRNWWGEQFAGKEYGFDAGPETIEYKIITATETSLTALKAEDIDVMRGIRSKDFVALAEDDDFKKLYRLHAPTQLAYSYIGLNMKNPKLRDKAVRKALSHIVNVEKIIKVVSYNLAVPTNSPINPAKPYYNKDIAGYAFDLEKAASILDEAGWKDTDGDGIRDKMIEGKKVQLVLNFLYVSGSKGSEQIALFLKEDAQKIGVIIEPITKEWTVFLDATSDHDFEMYSGGWVGSPALDDLKQIWHTQSYEGGSNYVGFGNARTDELIEKIRYEIDEEKRNAMYMEIQEIIHEEAPYIFLLSSKNKIAIHNRFDNARAYKARPGYMTREFKMNPDFGN